MYLKRIKNTYILITLVSMYIKKKLIFKTKYCGVYYSYGISIVLIFIFNTEQ